MPDRACSVTIHTVTLNLDQLNDIIKGDRAVFSLTAGRTVEVEITESAEMAVQGTLSEADTTVPDGKEDIVDG